MAHDMSNHHDLAGKPRPLATAATINLGTGSHDSVTLYSPFTRPELEVLCVVLPAITDLVLSRPVPDEEAWALRSDWADSSTGQHEQTARCAEGIYRLLAEYANCVDSFMESLSDEVRQDYTDGLTSFYAPEQIAALWAKWIQDSEPSRERAKAEIQVITLAYRKLLAGLCEETPEGVWRRVLQALNELQQPATWGGTPAPAVLPMGAPCPAAAAVSSAIRRARDEALARVRFDDE